MRSAAASAPPFIRSLPSLRSQLHRFKLWPRRRASIFELAADRAAFEARALLRRVALDTPGAKQIAAYPAVIAVLERRKDWIDMLERQIGGAITLRSDPSLPIHGGYAESR